jgi:SAM-dependent methyltransferase
MTSSVNDRWAAGDAYEAYMGRWSRALAHSFVDWLRPEPAGHWLEVGCGTGALTGALADRCRPSSIVACDPSPAFIEHARRRAADVCTFQVVSGTDELPRRQGGFDAVVSGLVLNFLPEPAQALTAMRERLRSGGVVAAYVWDYAGGVELLSRFWEAVVELDPGAGASDESRRFGAWQPPLLASLFQAAGLARVETAALEMATVFESFADYWQPFLAGTGPAPAYVVSLDDDRRERLRARLAERLPIDGDGRLRLRARAWSVRGAVP